VLRAQVDPNNQIGDRFDVGGAACCSASNPHGICNAPNAANNGVGINMVNALCYALGYKSGRIIREGSDNWCPEPHVTNTTGTNWTSDFVNSNGYGAEYECVSFR
jgi:hypothetical protein